MRKFSFTGGVFPPERKELSQNCAIQNVMPSSKRVCIPVTMGGAPNQVLVKVGDVVKKGQLIANGNAFMSVPVHSSVSGTVKKIGPVLSTANVDTLAVEIAFDPAAETEETDYMPVLDPFVCDKETALKRVKDAGIVGMGGASFPTHVKLNPPPTAEIDSVILNAAECEPYLTIDERTLLENPDKVVDGLAIVMQITGVLEKPNGFGYIGLEENKLHCVEGLQKAIDNKKYSDVIFIKIVKTKYPQGCEKMLTKAILNREIPTKGLPANIGCVICNVGTVCAISDAFRLGMPLIERPLTISGGAVKEPKNIRVPVGTMVSDLIGDVIETEGIAKILSGGPMMGFSMTNAQFPITKGTSGVLFLKKEEIAISNEGPCINCGMCLKSCPVHIVPALVIRQIDAGNLDKALNMGLMDCIECGSCTFSCPANIQILQRIRVAKNKVRAKMAADKAKADAAKAKQEGGK
ncbi:MAG: electron transport complex subunit RsxC [Treponema sp.]|nr:electron transport complex subunit RsxC [Treponema sp.]